MEIPYKSIKLEIHFQRPVSFFTFPTFVFRSVLGKELRRLCCLFKERECARCSIRYTCGYAVLFESHIPKDTEMLSGRDRAAHPFLIYADACTGETRSSLNLELTLIGKGTEYLPYIAYSLQRAGKSGLFRERVTYDITTSKLNGEYLIDEDGTLKADVPTSLWSIDSSDTPVDQKLRIEFITPLRLRIQGRYTDRFRPNDIIDASARRLAILSDLYGKGGTDTGRLSCDGITVTDQSFKWVDHPYYSSRQGTKMQMGGVTGFMDIKGSISPAQLSVLKGGELFHIGKNTGFGLGKISVARM